MARSYELRDKVVFITGAARGIGAETARQVVAKGARVALVGLEPELLEQRAAELGDRNAVWFEADVTDVDALQAAVDGTLERFGGIDVAIANAGHRRADAAARRRPRALRRRGPRQPQRRLPHAARHAPPRDRPRRLRAAGRLAGRRGARADDGRLLRDQGRRRGAVPTACARRSPTPGPRSAARTSASSTPTWSAAASSPSPAARRRPQMGPTGPNSAVPVAKAGRAIVRGDRAARALRLRAALGHRRAAAAHDRPAAPGARGDPQGRRRRDRARPAGAGHADHRAARAPSRSPRPRRRRGRRRPPRRGGPPRSRCAAAPSAGRRTRGCAA